MSDTPDRARTCEDDGEQHNWVHSSLGIPGFPWLIQCSVCRAYDKQQMQADYERDVAAAEERGWNAALEAAIKAVDDVYPVSDQWGHHTLPHIDRRQASAAIAALRKPEVEG